MEKSQTEVSTQMKPSPLELPFKLVSSLVMKEQDPSSFSMSVPFRKELKLLVVS